MAGHSKWANIKHKKAAQDAKRGKVFTKLIREITVAAKQGANPEDNPRLRAAIEKALANNMKRDTIDKAAQRGAGGVEGENYEELTYEGYAPGGVALLIAAMTDNRNRTIADIRHAFAKRGGSLGTDGSVAYLFEKRGQITFAPGVDTDSLMDAAIESGAEDVQLHEDGSVDLFCPWESVAQVNSTLQKAGFTPDMAEVAMVAATTVPLDKEGAEKVLALVEMLEDLDDVQTVYSNAEISDEVLAQLD